MKNGFSEEQLDALREIFTIGAGNAATALSQVVKKRIDISIPKIMLVPMEDTHMVFGGSEKIVTTTFVQLLGDASGVILLTFESAAADKLSDLLVGGSGPDVNDEMKRSALKEATTILSGAYLNAMSRFLKMSFLITNPGLTTDMSGAIIDDVMLQTSKSADHAMIINTEFSVVGERVMTYFFFIPDALSLDKILRSMGMKG